MTPEESAFIRDFFRNTTDQPLDPDDPRYVPLYAYPLLSADDPVELLARAIEWTPGATVQLLSGFRGAGKSTELRRLRKRLEGSGYIVLLFDIENYLNLAARIDISDFLMAVAGAFGEEVERSALLPAEAGQESYWDRLKGFFQRSQVDVKEIGVAANVGVASMDIKANLKTDPTFRERLQRHIAGYLGPWWRTSGHTSRRSWRSCVRTIRSARASSSSSIPSSTSAERRPTRDGAAAAREELRVVADRLDER
jgi:hypothetical protein